MRKYVASGFSPGFPELSRSCRQVAHVLLTRPPLVPQALTPKGDCLLHALDLHVLGTPPAFVLSQDQTLQKSLPRLTPINHGSLSYSKLISGVDHPSDDCRSLTSDICSILVVLFSFLRANYLAAVFSDLFILPNALANVNNFL